VARNMHLQYPYGKFAPVAIVLLVTILLTSFSAVPGVPLSDNLKIHYKALAQQQLNNGGQGSDNITTVASFNASEGQLPEGVAIMDDSIFVSFAPRVQVARLNESLTGSNTTTIRNQNDTTFTEVGSWPAIPQNSGFMLGLAFDRQENLYAAIASQTPQVKSGVYRIGPEGGNATLFATHPMMQIPNALVFNERGQLYISDSGAATIFLAQPNGTVTEWLSHPLLQGNSTFCPNTPDLQMNIGANGMVLDRSKASLFVANSDRASIIRVPIGPDDSAGEPEVFIGPDCENLAGADGMVIDETANDLVIAVNKLNKIVKVSTDNRTISTVASGGVLDFPASLAIKKDMEDPINSLGESTQGDLGSNATERDRTLYITNFAFLSAQQNLEEPNPALLSMQLGNASDVGR
jgi:sugar lactone lactonase YvrE